jgi:outer membrane protein assembly factor BamB
MKRVLFILLLGIFLLVSCKKEELPVKKIDENGIIIMLPQIWKLGLHLSTPVSNSAIRAPIYYGENIGIPVTNGDNNRYLGMVNSNTGELLWKWDERYHHETESVDINYYLQYQNLLTYTMGGRCYCINIDNGSTSWKKQRNLSFIDQLYGKDSIYYTFSNSETKYLEYDESVVYRGNILTGEIHEYLSPNFSCAVLAPGNRIGDVTAALPYTINGVEHLVIIWQEPPTDWDWQSYVGLYNCEARQWVYEKVLMDQPAESGVLLAPPVIHNGRVYANIGTHIVCHDIATGAQKWNKAFPHDFMFAGFIIAENRLIASCENEILYCLDPFSGSLLWQTKGSGTSSRLAYLNGIVYFVGGGDGKLHAVEAATGKTVWLLDGEKFLGGDWFTSYNAVYVFPENDEMPARVIALNHGYAYCFEAYQ